MRILFGHKFLFSLIAILFLMCACRNPGAVTASPHGEANACASRAEDAAQRIEAVVAVNGSCSSDADCIHVELSTLCFDRCTRSVSTSGQKAIDAAIAEENEGVCKSFESDGCTRIIPPCAPSRTPICNRGTCE